MILNKPNVVIYFRRDNLVAAGKHVNPARLNFPADIVNNLEIVRPDKFISGCQDFFASKGLKGKRVLIVLDPAVVFTKKVELDKQGKPAALTRAFIEAMPFAKGQRACLSVRQGSTLGLYAANAELYETVVKALDESGVGKVVAVTPAAAYDVTIDKQLAAAMDAFANTTAVHSRYDFLDCEPV